jgi:hypothetical protein
MCRRRSPLYRSPGLPSEGAGGKKQDLAMNILQAIGNTSLVELRKLVPPDSARILDSSI